MNIANRIRILRKDKLNLTQSLFGEKLNVKTSTVAGWENGSRMVNERTKKDICRVFKVSLLWLEKGVGDVFTNLPETLLDEIADEYNLNSKMKKLIKTLLELDEQSQDVLINILIKKALTFQRRRRFIIIHKKEKRRELSRPSSTQIILKS